MNSKIKIKLNRSVKLNKNSDVLWVRMGGLAIFTEIYIIIFHTVVPVVLVSSRVTIIY